MASDVRKELERAGAARQQARKEAREASAQISELVLEAIEAGIPKIEIARLAQISRPALDTMLRKRSDSL